jgi:hypothetical protein
VLVAVVKGDTTQLVVQVELAVVVRAVTQAQTEPLELLTLVVVAAAAVAQLLALADQVVLEQ